MKKQQVHPYLWMFAIGFGTNVGIWRDGHAPLWLKVVEPVGVGLVMIPLGCLIAIPLVWMFRKLGVMPPDPRNEQTDQEKP